MGEGEGRATTTTAVTTTCSAATKAWTAAYNIPSATNHGAGGAAVG